MKLADLQGKNIAILGFGLEGKSTLNFLMNQNITFKNLTILDVNQHLKTSALVSSVTGTHYLNDLDQYDVIFKSAGIPMSEKLEPYKDKIITQVQFFFDNYPGKVIAVTATKGKSTMSSLIYKILKDAGCKVELVGNIGNPVLDEVDFTQHYDYIVIELSSYMLTTLKKKNFISVLGSIFPEHLDRHGSFSSYVKAKLTILNGSEYNVVHRKTIKECRIQEDLITSPDGGKTHIIPYGSEGKYRWYYDFFMEDNKKLFSENDRNILGEHNLDNICAALAVGDIIHLPLKTVHESIRTFTGLPHRMEHLGSHGGIEWIDDAISTTPESTIQAIKTFGKKIGTIFLGGTDRGYDFKELVKCVLDYKIHNVVLFPDSGKKIGKLLMPYTQVKTLEIQDMKAAVQFALDHTKKGEICLLSTASPSYSVWKNFEEKGDLFKKHILELA